MAGRFPGEPAVTRNPGSTGGGLRHGTPPLVGVSGEHAPGCLHQHCTAVQRGGVGRPVQQTGQPAKPGRPATADAGRPGRRATSSTPRWPRPAERAATGPSERLEGPAGRGRGGGRRRGRRPRCGRGGRGRPGGPAAAAPVAARPGRARRSWTGSISGPGRPIRGTPGRPTWCATLPGHRHQPVLGGRAAQGPGHEQDAGQGVVARGREPGPEAADGPGHPGQVALAEAVEGDAEAAGEAFVGQSAGGAAASLRRRTVRRRRPDW